jgi:hypothetical protein
VLRHQDSSSNRRACPRMTLGGMFLVSAPPRGLVRNRGLT